jgi:hypothetical protein
MSEGAAEVDGVSDGAEGIDGVSKGAGGAIGAASFLSFDAEGAFVAPGADGGRASPGCKWK